MKAILYILPLLVLSPFVSHAASCVQTEPNLAHAVYEDGEFTLGFTVTYEFTGNLCDAAPTVREADAKIFEIFTALAKTSSSPLTDGVYMVPFQCMEQDGMGGCFPKGSLEKISDTPEDYVREKLEWQGKAHNASRVSGAHKWFSFGLILSIFFLAVAFPWLIIMKKPHLRTRLPILLSIAIPVQIAVVFVNPLFVLSYDVVSEANKTISNIVLVIVLIEIAYLVYAFATRNKGRVFPDNNNQQ